VNFAGCFAEEAADGQLVNRATGQPLTAGDACVTRGANISYDHRAHRDAVRQVTALLRRAWRLEP
jgi:hypothetical protein